MSTEDPAVPGLVRTSPEQVTKVGDVELRSGLLLLLQPGTFYYSEEIGHERPVLLEITRIGHVLPGETHVYIEGYRHEGSTTWGLAVAVQITALADALLL